MQKIPSSRTAGLPSRRAVLGSGSIEIGIEQAAYADLRGKAEARVHTTVIADPALPDRRQDVANPLDAVLGEGPGAPAPWPERSRLVAVRSQRDLFTLRPSATHRQRGALPRAPARKRIHPGLKEIASATEWW